VFGQLAHDPKGAGVFGGVEIPRPERPLLVRSGRAVVDELVTALRHDRPSSAPATAAAAPLPDATASGHRAAAQRALRRRRAPAGAA
jgi:hypothetical protein